MKEALAECDRALTLDPDNEVFRQNKLTFETGKIERLIDTTGKIIRSRPFSV
jgi:hypothetical protein